MKKFWLHASIIGLAGLLPLVTIAIVGNTQAHKYRDTFYGALTIKDDRLESIKEKKKIVFIGGSSLSFGLRSDMMSEALGYEVVDYGLYAPLGTKTMAELARRRINPNDIVVFAPELSQETYSTNMNYNMLLKCMEDKPNLFSRFASWDDQFNICVNYPGFVFERGGAAIEAVAPYDKASFNAYGDIESDLVTWNILPELYDSSQLVAPSEKYLDKSFIAYVNDYTSYMKSKGVTTFFMFSPTNALALQEEGLEAFEKGLSEKLSAKVLGTVKEATYHQNYFYDTNYHLNYAGTVVHSKNLTTLLAKELSIEVTYEFPAVEMPDAKYEPHDPPVDPTESPFRLEMVGNEYFLKGVDDSLKDQEVVVVPEEVDGHLITGISREAFKDFDKLKYVILPSRIDNLANDIFLGCSTLERIYLTNETAPTIVGNGLLNGCNSFTKIYILRSARRTYLSGYTWTSYQDRFALFNLEDIQEYLPQEGEPS